MVSKLYVMVPQQLSKDFIMFCPSISQFLCACVWQHIADRLFNNLNQPGTSGFKPTTLSFALFTLEINIKSPNYFYELKFLGNTYYQGSY
jgi:hypothetical protein